MEASKSVWEGAIPLQIHLHESEVTTLPPPPPAVILAPRIGYLPLLVSLVRPYFSTALPPGVDTLWFEYKGLPLKWYIPTGVLFDLLCAEPERPWNLTVHFRGYPGNMLTPCEGEDAVKWNYINSLKEAAYIINGNCKNIMNMSQSDQLELWRAVMTGNLDSYTRVSSKLKLGGVEDEYSKGTGATLAETDVAGHVKTGRIPVRLYLWSVSEDFDDYEDFPMIDSWDKVSYINQPVEFHKEEGKCFTLLDAIKSLLPAVSGDRSLIHPESSRVEGKEVEKKSYKDTLGVIDKAEDSDKQVKPSFTRKTCELKIIRIQGIEPKWEIPFSWVANNLMNPDYFLHLCVCIKVPQVNSN